jgi:hypothetical protein
MVLRPTLSDAQPNSGWISMKPARVARLIAPAVALSKPAVLTRNFSM